MLVGGGHSHALLVRRWAMEPLAGVRLTLVSRDVLTPYSGMLPGLIAGHYTVDDVHIDLTRLCAWAGVRFVRADMTGLDPVRREITLAGGRPPISWDLLSLDTGSTPDLSVPGAAGHATPVKPVADFHARWQRVVERAGSGGERVAIGVVGSGAGGFELITAMRHVLPAGCADCHWFLRGERPLTGRPARLGRRALAAAHRAGIEVHSGFDVVKVTEDGVEARDGRAVALDETLWCTAASGPDWPAKAGLETDARGFVATDGHLRSVSHPRIFATGDIGTQRDTPSAKAGVFAVRQAPFLFANLRATLLGQPLRRYRPQRDFLSLMATGGRSAIASRGPLVVEGTAIWRWKDHIDRTFMRRFAELPTMPSRTLPPLVPDALLEVDEHEGGVSLDTGMQCRGCGAKIGGDLLDEVIGTLDVAWRADIPTGLADADDVAVFDPGARWVVQSVDQLDAIVDDPWLFGRIAALHAMSDVFTATGHVHSAQVLVTLPQAHERITRRELHVLMHAVVETLREEGATLVGGHTAEGAALSIGLVVNALREPTTAATAAASDGDALVLTQAIGIGTVFAGLARARARGVDIEAALEVMRQSNRRAADILREHGSHTLTDVTGFGLLGHLVRLPLPDGVAAAIDVDAIPLLPGALELAGAGIRSSLWGASSQVLSRFDGLNDVPLAMQYLLCDPQTGGGLLGVVPWSRAAACVEALVAAGHAGSAVVGRLEARERHALRGPCGSGRADGRNSPGNAGDTLDVSDAGEPRHSRGSNNRSERR